MNALASPLARSEVVRPQVQPVPLKESIRDMLYLQRHYQISDELFWEIFDNRVLLNQPIDRISDFGLRVYVAAAQSKIPHLSRF